jgi:hypothetical protein
VPAASPHNKRLPRLRPKPRPLHKRIRCQYRRDQCQRRQALSPDGESTLMKDLHGLYVYHPARSAAIAKPDRLVAATRHLSSPGASEIFCVPISTCVDPTCFLHERLQLRPRLLAVSDIPQCRRRSALGPPIKDAALIGVTKPRIERVYLRPDGLGFINARRVGFELRFSRMRPSRPTLPKTREPCRSPDCA